MSRQAWGARSAKQKYVAAVASPTVTAMIDEQKKEKNDGIEPWTSTTHAERLAH